MLQRLISLFAGKLVRITHTNDLIPSTESGCRTVYPVKHSNEFEIKLKDGRRFSFIPEEITLDSVEGPLPYGTGGRRKIQVVAADEKTNIAPSGDSDTLSDFVEIRHADDAVTMPTVESPFEGRGGLSGGAGAGGSWEAPEAEAPPETSEPDPSSSDSGDSSSTGSDDNT